MGRKKIRRKNTYFSIFFPSTAPSASFLLTTFSNSLNRHIEYTPEIALHTSPAHHARYACVCNLCAALNFRILAASGYVTVSRDR